MGQRSWARTFGALLCAACSSGTPAVDSEEDPDAGADTVDAGRGTPDGSGDVDTSPSPLVDQVPACTPDAPILDPVARHCVSRDEGIALCRVGTTEIDSTDPSDATCGAACICERCPKLQLLCLGHDQCRGILECLTRTACELGTECISVCGAAYQENGTIVGAGAQIVESLNSCFERSGCRRNCEPVADAGGG